MFGQSALTRITGVLVFTASVLGAIGCLETSTSCREGYTKVDGDCIMEATDGGTDGDAMGDGDVGDDAGPDAEADAGPCGDACGGDTPVCDTDAVECVACLGDDDCSSAEAPACGTEGGEPACVECTGDAHCDGAAPRCDTDAQACVECVEPADCTDPAAGRCDVPAGECKACEADADCEHLSETPVCDEPSGTCVGCTPDTETSDCGGTSCDPATLECTDTPVDSVRRCGACRADSECSQDGDRCVPMEYMGSDRDGGYCLKQLDMGCGQPYTVPTPERESLSGAAAEVYCGIDESSTTCEAVLSLIDNADCTEATEADDCGVAGVDDGRCESVNGVANKCTYSCEMSSQCTSVTTCPNMDYCGDTT